MVRNTIKHKNKKDRGKGETAHKHPREGKREKGKEEKRKENEIKEKGGNRI